ncbi:hypothetical protein C8F04DRAFT_1102100 [Mycena alexandri]|uniref:Uncharacterized protein n=1 Tax=Mycena alexandri TaxID=1745969 RepID=A0AAD6X2J2_9AGAR|nr:hypothetical protein C8F04DRAFT_1102100 [Mycena alexandri]
MTSGQSFSFSSTAPPSSSYSRSTSRSRTHSNDRSTYTTTVTVYECPPSGGISASTTPTGTVPSEPTGISGPSACPVSSQSASQSASFTPTPTPDPCGSAPVHPRNFALAPRAPTDPASAKVKGEQIWALIGATTADKDPSLTTAKFLAGYAGARPVFTISQDLSTNVKGGLGNEIWSVFNKQTENGVDLEHPLLPALATTLRRRTARTPLTYDLVFAPGVIVSAIAFKKRDPVPEAEQVNWNVIAMELYREYKGGDVSDLKYVLQLHIDNDVTQAALVELYTNSRMATDATARNTDWTRWDANDGGCGTNAVLTLLGTDNGSGSGFLLVDYRATLSGRDIGYMYTRRQSSWWDMVVEYV